MQATVQEIEHIVSDFRGMEGPSIKSGGPLERDPLRRFVQAIMDTDPSYYSDEFIADTKFDCVVAPPLYPVHAFRPRLGAPDPLESLWADPDADGAGGNEGVFFGLPPIVTPLKRLLNGGNEIEFYKNLRLGEYCIVTAKYADILVKESKGSPLLLVTIQSTFRNDSDEVLLINRQTLIWR